MGFLMNMVQLKISFIGFNNNIAATYGKPTASYKVIEISVALLTFGVRITVRV